MFEFSAAQEKPMELWADSAACIRGQTGIELPIHLINRIDTVAGFTLFFFMEQPDLMQFSSIGIDTQGTLVSGWNIYTNSIGGYPHNLMVTGIADIIPPSPNYLDFQDGTMPLFNLKLDIYNVPDTITDSIVHIHIEDAFLDLIGFSDNHGDAIGVIQQEVTDTNFFVCLDWIPGPNGDECAWWEQVSFPPYDSMEITAETVTRLDTAYFRIDDGSMTILMCGDIAVYKTINILDIVALINYKFKHDSVPDYLETADVNADGAIDILDIINLVNYKFKGGLAPACY